MAEACLVWPALSWGLGMDRGLQRPRVTLAEAWGREHLSAALGVGCHVPRWLTEPRTLLVNLA